MTTIPSDQRRWRRFAAAVAETPSGGFRAELGDAVYMSGSPGMSVADFYAAITRYECTVGWCDTHAEARAHAAGLGLILGRRAAAA